MLSVSLIFLTVSCSSGCGKVKWTARPYVGDPDNSQLVGVDGSVIKCDQPSFSTYTCFDKENIADLMTAIGRSKISKKKKSKAIKVINKILRRD